MKLDNLQPFTPLDIQEFAKRDVKALSNIRVAEKTRPAVPFTIDKVNASGFRLWSSNRMGFKEASWQRLQADYVWGTASDYEKGKKVEKEEKPEEELPSFLDVQPSTLEEVVAFLVKKISPDSKEKFKMGEITPASVHSSFGGMLRDAWELWNPHNLLCQHFAERGLAHADDISGVILETFCRELRGEPWNVDEQVKKYQEYWKREVEVGQNERLRQETSTITQDELDLAEAAKAKREESKEEGTSER